MQLSLLMPMDRNSPRLLVPATVAAALVAQRRTITLFGDASAPGSQTLWLLLGALVSPAARILICTWHNAGCRNGRHRPSDGPDWRAAQRRGAHPTGCAADRCSQQEAGRPAAGARVCVRMDMHQTTTAAGDVPVCFPCLHHQIHSTTLLHMCALAVPLCLSQQTVWLPLPPPLSLIPCYACAGGGADARHTHA